jgi:hypothetical protein
MSAPGDAGNAPPRPAWARSRRSCHSRTFGRFALKSGPWRAGLGGPRKAESDCWRTVGYSRWWSAWCRARDGRRRRTGSALPGGGGLSGWRPRGRSGRRFGRGVPWTRRAAPPEPASPGPGGCARTSGGLPRPPLLSGVEEADAADRLDQAPALKASRASAAWPKPHRGYHYGPTGETAGRWCRPRAPPRRRRAASRTPAAGSASRPAASSLRRALGAAEAGQPPEPLTPPPAPFPSQRAPPSPPGRAPAPPGPRRPPRRSGGGTPHEA